MKRILSVISIILILFLTFSAVQAADNETAVNDKTFEAIQAAIDNANDNDTIILEGIYSGSGNPIVINKSVIIKASGSDVKLDAGSKSQVFQIQSDNVVLENLAIVNGVSTAASGIAYGGAVNAEGNNLCILKCNFTSSSARYGGALYCSGNNVSILNCQFSKNTVEYSGGAFELDGDDCHVEGCIFTGNVAYHVGGDVAWVGNSGTLLNCQFNSISDKTKASQFGGAVVWMGKNGKMSKSVFKGYYAKKYGSAVYWRGDNGSFTYSIMNTTNPYWGNPDYAGNNYWGVNSNSADDFISHELIYFNDSYQSPQIWVNLEYFTDSINFTSNDGNALNDSMPNYMLSSGVEMINNSYIIKKATSFTCSNLVTYSLYDGKYLSIVLKSGSSKLASKSIQIKVNGKTYTRTTNAQGLVKFKISLKTPKTYTVTVKFNGDKYYKAASKSVKVTVKKQKPTITVKKASKKLVRVVLKDQFKKVMAKKTLKLTINKKTYRVKTNSKGVATFKISLKAKKTYRYSVKYAGSSYYSSVLKKASLKVK
ncbi:MAG: Ig-like domain-containing protein [Methanobrevibacter sp.]|nr:Ig-like domain-containing protein [Methanobrevibacter sp.]